MRERAVLPYEQQRDRWSCGAASLCMVYRSLGLPAIQEEVHQRMRLDPLQLLPRGRTLVELTRDPLTMGLAVIPLRAAHPWAALQTSCRSSLQIVLRHRMRIEHAGGHFSVLRDMEPDAVILHDPTEGPDFRVARERFLALWEGVLSGYESTANTLVAIGPPDRDNLLPCPCPHCARMVMLGSFIELLRVPVWQEILCPWCGHCLMNLSGGSGNAVPTAN